MSGQQQPGIITTLQTQGTRARLRVVLESSECVAAGRAFWDLHSQSVEYHMVPHHPYHSFIDGDRFRIETDVRGRPILVEIKDPQIGSPGICPSPAAPSDVRSTGLRFLDLRIRSRALYAAFDTSNSLSFLKLLAGPPVVYGAVAAGAIWGVDDQGFLSAVWLTGIKNDPSGQKRGRWRRRRWASVRRHAMGTSRERTLLPISVAKENSNRTIFA